MSQVIANRLLPTRPKQKTAKASGGAAHEYFSSLTFLCLSLIGYYQLLPSSWLTIIMLACIAQRIYFRIDRALIILEIAALIAILQCVVGPLLMYESAFVHHKYMMYVNPNTYFSFAIPAICLFVAALCLPVFGNTNIGIQIRDSKQMDRLGWYLLAISLVGIVGSHIGLGFFAYLLVQLKYVAAICLFMSNNRFRWPVLLAVLFSGYLTAAEYGMFHELLIWGSFVGSFIFLHKKRSHALKITVFASAIIAVLTIQGVKAEYREALADGKTPNLTDALLGVLWSLESVYEDKDFQHLAVTRLNQGWIVSRVMQYVPVYEPYAKGETISTTISASLTPRFLKSNKEGAGGRTNFVRFTGLQLSANTSMCIGTLGEAYANFGKDGGILMMLVLGGLLNKAFAYFVTLGKFNGYFLLCLPLVFLQVIKSETEMIVITNHFVKATIVILLLYLILPRAFGSKRKSKRTGFKNRHLNNGWQTKASPIAMMKQ